ncbi:hypothetical protein ACP3V6_19745, partial [Vibrio sp. DNB22_19_1]
MDFSQLKAHQNIRLIEYTLENKNYSVDKACSDLGITAREFHFAKATLFTMTPYQTDELTSSQCSGQQTPDTDLSRFSAFTGDSPSFA